MEAEQLVTRILQGDQEAFRELVEQYSQHVFHTAYSVLRDVKEAEDASQEVFLQVYRALPQYRSEGFKTWITRITLNKAIDIKRKLSRKVHEQAAEGMQELDKLPSQDEDVVALLIRKEKREELQNKLGVLPDNHREVVTAFYLDEKNYEQIAAELNTTVKTVESKLYRARQWIRKRWKKEEWR
ncbi:RNA polymerase sigma factor [Paenibacillus sp. 7541]|uniref:RNA polymerase subunit sigma n=1 Tax=Paenibacillus campinasensis TaxID=66347 RepID=A0A268F343_9BACL|nr:RNA polymerase sigma factor [Paenibacillus sp. 7541]MUG65055.1 sigma-70 family RNA polymerase sigma factor [Paenibacillus campinasensis]PAD79807.1 RNA polymerase subunit sigma [Paenibacillus campinasensis]